MAHVVIVGSGIAGIGAALALSKRGHKITLIDKGKFGGLTSPVIPGRMGHGFHYSGLSTAIAYLNESIRIQRKYPNYLIGKERPESDPIRHGRYFVTKNSTQDPEEVRELYIAIQNKYARLVAIDRRNKVFGEPDKFLRFLKPEEYEHQVNSDLVAFAVETNEHLFNCKAFFEDIKKVMQKDSNITLIEGAEVTSINRGDAGKSRFVINYKQKNRHAKRAIQADFVVNSTLDQIEKLNNTLGGIYIEPNGRTNRLKCILTVKLPESLINANSMFFCFGKHCMLSNMGNGIGMITYADVTNMEASTDINLSPYASRLLNREFAPEEYEGIKRDLGAKMLAGAAKYIPELAHAQYLDVNFGIVQTKEPMTLNDLTNPKHGFNIRDYDGVREELLGYLSNPGIKWFYFNRNGRIVAKMIKQQMLEANYFRSLIYHPDRKLHDVLKRVVIDNIELYSAPKKRRSGYPGVMLVDSMLNTMEKKKLVMQQLEQIAEDVNAPFKEEGSACQIIAPTLARKIVHSQNNAAERTQIAETFYFRTRLGNEKGINERVKKALTNNYTLFSPITSHNPNERKSSANAVDTIIKTVENKKRLLQEFEKKVHDVNLIWDRAKTNPAFIETLSPAFAMGIANTPIMDEVGLMFLITSYAALSSSISSAASGLYFGADAIIDASIPTNDYQFQCERACN